MGRLKFVVLLYCLAAGGLLGTLMTAYENLSYSLFGVDGTLTSNDPVVARAAKYAPGSTIVADVAYLTNDGKVEVARKHLGAAIVARLAKGERIDVRFIRFDPERAYYDNDRPKWEWVWIVAWLIAWPVARFAHRLYRREGGLAGDVDVGDAAAD